MGIICQCTGLKNSKGRSKFEGRYIPLVFTLIIYVFCPNLYFHITLILNGAFTYIKSAVDEITYETNETNFLPLRYLRYNLPGEPEPQLAKSLYYDQGVAYAKVMKNID